MVPMLARQSSENQEACVGKLTALSVSWKSLLTFNSIDHRLAVGPAIRTWGLPDFGGETCPLTSCSNNSVGLWGPKSAAKSLFALSAEIPDYIAKRKGQHLLPGP